MQRRLSVGLGISCALLAAVSTSGCDSPAGADGGPGGGDSGGPVDTGCEARPEQCEQLGLYFGVCDGVQDPVMACDEGRCFWYAGGCPVGMHASDCASDDICCHETDDGRWPFADWEPDGSEAKIELINDVAAIGSTPIDSQEPSELAITFDPTVTAPAEGVPYVRCSPGNPLTGCADWSILPIRRVGISLIVTLRTNKQGEWLYLELVDTLPDAVARVFLRYQEDAFPESVPTTCAPSQPRFTSGTLRLSSLDESAHGRLRAELADGHWVELDF